MSGEQSLEYWKEVHQQLINAVLISKDAIAVQKAQRRYWLAEINANLTPEGKLTNNSVWKRPSRRGKRGSTAGSATTTVKGGTKRKKKETVSNAGEKPAVKKRKYTRRKKQTEEEKLPQSAAIDTERKGKAAVKPKPKLRLSLKASSMPSVKNEVDDETEDEEQEEEENGEDEVGQGQSFLMSGDSSKGTAMAANAPDPQSYASFLPGGRLDREDGFSDDEDTEEDDD